jgi:hypothetical protein
MRGNEDAVELPSLTLLLCYHTAGLAFMIAEAQSVEAMLGSGLGARLTSLISVIAEFQPSLRKGISQNSVNP